MTFGLLVTGAALVALPGLARAVARRLAPAECTLLVASALMIGVFAVEAGLVLLALPTVLRALGVVEIADACARVVGHLAPGGPLAGWAAVAAAAVVAGIGVRSLYAARAQARRLWAEPGLGHHLPLGGAELVELPTTAVLALAVPGPRPQVVVSRGLVEALDPVELEAVIRHETAHLALGHRRYLVLAALVEQAFGFAPIARRSAAVLRGAVERWADETAAGPDAQWRDALDRAMVTVAGERVVDTTPTPRTLDRVAAATAGPRWWAAANRVGLYGPATVLLVAAAAFLIGWVIDAEHVIALGGYCPD